MIKKVLDTIFQQKKQKVKILLTSIDLINFVDTIKNDRSKFQIYIISYSNAQTEIITKRYNMFALNKNINNMFFDVCIDIDSLQLLNILNRNQIQYLYTLSYKEITGYNNIGSKFKGNWYKKGNIITKRIDNQKVDLYNLQLVQFPILIRTRNRLNYLRYTIHSLLKTSLYNSKIFIVDDNSTQKDVLDFLYTNKKRKYQTIDFYSQLKNKENIQEWNKNIGLLPLLPSQQYGIANKIQVVKLDKNYGDVNGLMKTIQIGFQKYPNAPFIVILQDDIIFSKKWLSKCFQIYKANKNIGLISVYNKSQQKRKNQEFYISKEINGPQILITKEYYLKLKQNNYLTKQYVQLQQNINIKQKAFTQLQKYNIAGDTHLAYYCSLFKQNIIKSCNSYIQHIGISSTLQHTQLRTVNNFVKPIQFQKNLKLETNKEISRILIFSNIYFPKYKVQQLDIKDSDLLVFLNTAVPIQYFNQHKNKIIFYRWSNKGYFGIDKTKELDCKKYGLDGPNSNLTKQQQNQIKARYSQQFMTRSDVVYKNSLVSYHSLRIGPTTGWAIQQLMKIRYPKAIIELVNFFPTQDNSTPHFVGHDWKFQNQFYKNSQIKVYDLRETLEIVYILDKNQKFINLCKLSIQSLLKYNKKVHITIVSQQKIDIGYDNFILSDFKDFNFQFKEGNDRITKATYLKLFLTRLPYDKCLVIDPDTLVLNSLSNLYSANINYVGMTQSHNYGIQQAKILNHQKYFLAGVMLMNLKHLREIDFENYFIKCSHNINSKDFKNSWQHQQTMLNKFFYDKITQLHIKYNYCYNRKYIHPLTQKEIIILHFPGNNKQDMISYYNKNI